MIHMDSKDQKAVLSITSISVTLTIYLKVSTKDISLTMIPSSRASLAKEMVKVKESLSVALEDLEASVEEDLSSIATHSLVI